jgi:S-adenosylmethionine hydrolase
MSAPLPITFLSDYGHDDEFVGVCHGVIQRVLPGAVVIDVAHGLPRGEVRQAAFVMRNSLAYMPPGVHLAVVDPGVGGGRRPVALRSGDGRLFVGPDNGLLRPAAERSGGVQTAVDLSESPYRLEPVSATFHGRDVFAPVAARLAHGTAVEDVGEPFPASDLVDLAVSGAIVGDHGVEAHVLHVDRFGNVQLNADRGQIAALGLRSGDPVELETDRGRWQASYGRTFSDVPERGMLVYEDSSEVIAVAVNQGNAARTLGLGANARIRLAPRR